MHLHTAQPAYAHYFRNLHQCEIGRIVAAGGFTGFIPDRRKQRQHLLLHAPQLGLLHVFCLFVYTTPRIFPRSGSFSRRKIKRHTIPNPHWVVISTSGAKMEAHVRPAPRRLEIQNNANFNCGMISHCIFSHEMIFSKKYSIPNKNFCLIEKTLDSNSN